jgi:hypothetical protein
MTLRPIPSNLNIYLRPIALSAKMSTLELLRSESQLMACSPALHSSSVSTRLEDGMSRQLLRPTLALHAAPTRSFIFDLPAAKPAAARERPAEPDPAATDAYREL